MLQSTAPFARPRRWTNYLARTEDRQQLSLIWRKRPVGVCCCLVPVQCRTEYRNLPKLSPSDCSLRVITAESLGLDLLRKARIRASPLGIPGTSSTPLHRSDLDSGQLFVETVVLTSLVTVAGLRVSASPAVSGLTVVGHRSTLELQQAPVRIQQTTTSSHKWDKVSLAQLIVPLVRLGSPRNRRVAIVPSELWGLCCTRLLSSQRWVGN